MARTPLRKELVGARLLKPYASWIYCTGCEKTVAYLCYVTYDRFDFSFQCNCGNEGHVLIEFEGCKNASISNQKLLSIKNRLHCPKDDSALLSIVEKNLENYQYEILCNGCGQTYSS